MVWRAVPGALRVSVGMEPGQTPLAAALDAGCPLSGRPRQTQFPLPKGTGVARPAPQGEN